MSYKPNFLFDGVHLVGKDIKALHALAAEVLLKRCWYDGNPKHPHYDVKDQRVKNRLLLRGITPISTRDLIKGMREWKNESES